MGEREGERVGGRGRESVGLLLLHDLRITMAGPARPSTRETTERPPGAAPAPRAQINAGCMRARTLMMSDAAGRTGKRKKEETRGAMREGGREVAGAAVRVRLHWNYVCTGCPAVDVTTLIAHNFLMPGPIIKQFHSIKVKTVRIFLVYDIGFYLVST